MAKYRKQSLCPTKIQSCFLPEAPVKAVALKTWQHMVQTSSAVTVNLFTRIVQNNKKKNTAMNSKAQKTLL